MVIWVISDRVDPLLNVDQYDIFRTTFAFTWCIEIKELRNRALKVNMGGELLSHVQYSKSSHTRNYSMVWSCMVSLIGWDGSKNRV